MDINWTILGFAGTIFFGILTVIFGVKAIRKPKIKHFEINSYEIGEGLMKEFPDLNISYGGTLIKNNFTVLKGGFISSGKDITGDNIWVEMTLPTGCKIIGRNIKTSDEYLKVTPTIDHNRVHFDIGTQFLHNDIFIYSLIVESTEKKDDLFDCLSFKHRLKDSPKIKNYGFVYIMSKQEYRVCLISWVILNIFVFSLYYYYKLPFSHFSNYFSIVMAQVPLIMFCAKFAQYKKFKRIEKVARKSNHNETI